MATYNVTFSTTGWVSYIVTDAESEKDAIRQAKAHAELGRVNGASYFDSEHLDLFDAEAELDEGYDPDDETANEEAARAELRGAGPEIDNLA